MQHTYNIKMRAALWTMLGVVCFAATLGSSSTWAQSGCFIDKNGTRACPVGPSPGGGSGGGSGGTSSTPSGPSPEQVKQQQERARLKAKAWSSDEALDYVDRKDWDNAIRSFEEALDRDPDDPELNDGLNRAKAEKARERAPAIASPPRPAPNNDSKVVDARVPRDGAYLTNQVPELKNSPAADRITKGFQAVIKHDWPVALAWWQDALNRDPNNAALKRSVDLAQWMVDKRKATAAGPVTPLGAALHSASRGDHAGAIRQFELAKKENPAIAPQADSMIDALRQRQAKDANDAKSAAYWNGEIKKGTQKMVDAMFETGMNRLSVGDEKGAQAAFNDADFFSGLNNVRPSQLPAPKPGKTK